jgi:hypothetical protein
MYLQEKRDNTTTYVRRPRTVFKGGLGENFEPRRQIYVRN